LKKEENFLQKLNSMNKEKICWLVLAEKALKNVWNNKKDEKTWSKYL